MSVGMESQGKGKKRPLPAWMKAVGDQAQKKTSKADTAESCKQDKDNDSSVPDAECIVNENATDKSNARTEIGENSAMKSSDDEPVKLSAAEFIAQSMPFLTFSGSVVYSYQESDCALICRHILSSLNDEEKTIIGFDMEWPVSYQKGAKDKTSLIQMCIHKTCYLFHISAMYSIPKTLLTLIHDHRVLLVGLNIEADLWKLARDFSINVKPIFDRKAVIDVGKLANEKLKSSERWSLEGLCKNVLRKRLDKDSHVRCGNWAEFPLTQEQKMYAATDAFAGLLLYQHLNEK
ncbi:Werner syndrome ATP-dependent helicase homolog [Aplysia californica]|uniref:3'-5' exonuclease n=1 Tax=Aplysia californica TaxID=6500 RepID=A0ABM0JDH8_APLCA|nr:Werner syndrome ATP-dependent helicase homolog [Aplysia californica]